MVQLTIITLSEYGEWTHCLGEDREHVLQILQSSVYATAQNLFSEKKGLVFQARSDEMYAITNTLTIKDHMQIHKELTSKFPVSITMTVAFDESPFKANEIAFRSSKFCQVPEYGFIYGTTQSENEAVHLIHIDVEGLTEISKKLSYFEVYSMIQKVQQKITEFFQQRNSLAFYMGGDNFIVISDGDIERHANEFVEYSKNVLGLSMNCGIGIGDTGRKAVMYATASLDMIRAKRNQKNDYLHVYNIQNDLVTLKTSNLKS
jgi:GTP cyclohydrolase IIa